MFCSKSVVFAATVSDAYDQPSSLEVSASANHKIVFQNASAVSEGDTIDITFPSDFDTSSITEDDVDVYVGSELTTASSCSGSEQVSVGVAAPFNRLTMTICPGDGGSILPGSTIEIEIGTNATASGTGANRIVNPSEASTYFLRISGSFGDFGSIPIPILTSGDATISGTVPSGSGGGGSGGGDVETPLDTSISVTSPNGGESYSYGDHKTVTWDYGSDVYTVNIYYSIDGGFNYISIASNETSDGTYNWTVPDVTSSNALIKIDAMDGSTILESDTSDAVFTIIGTAIGIDYTIEVLSPNGGEQVYTESLHEIQWDAGDYFDSFKIYYSLDNGSTFTLISQVEAMGGSFLWTIPVTEAENCYIKIEGIVDDAVLSEDVSDEAFSIVTTDDEEIVEEEDEDDEDDEEDEDDEDDEDDEETDDSGSEGGSTEDDTTVEDGSDEGTEVVAERGAEVSVTDESGMVELIDGENITVISGRDLIVSAEVRDGENLDNISIVVGSNVYYPALVGEGKFISNIPVQSGDDSITIIVDYIDGQNFIYVFSVSHQKMGFVYEVIDGVNTAVGGAIVTVYNKDSDGLVQWNGGAYNQDNPVVLADDGLIAWYVGDGSYTVTAGRFGYGDAKVSLSVSNGVLAPDIRMVKETVVIEDSTVGQEDDQDTFLENTQQTVDEIVRQFNNTSKAVNAALVEVRSIPEIQTAATVATPVIVGGAVASAVVLSTSFNLWQLLQYLITAPILLIARRKRQNFGIVYNAYTKAPIDFAVVRLYTQAKKLIRTMVTDQEGRYFFKVEPGMYFIRVQKPGFNFPSAYLSGRSEDGNFLDVYTNGYIEVSDKNAIISANIPIDPIGDEKIQSPRKIIFKRFLRLLQNLIAVIGIILAVFVYIIQPGIFSLSMIVIQVLFYVATKILARPKQKKGWGIVREKKTKKAIQNAVVRLFEPKYNKLLETSVTDRKGRYAFLAGANEYFVTVEKPGFEKETIRPIDYRSKKVLTPIAVDVGLVKRV
ncbi:carboxypeptidase-like regulatory domain-containing protein [Patescibacteria group bacterium]|nr:carboxypeptidase-like regulatory domain-containing protein [Patescibacteria group bacterium]